jgi:hypothetical protein
MGIVCNTHGREEAYRVLVEKLEGKRRIILKCF